MTKQQKELGVLAGLVVVGIFAYVSNRSHGAGVTGVSADVKFVPLSVQEPQLRLDLLAKLQQETGAGPHRNIFDATPPPPPPTAAQVAAQRAQSMGPQTPPPPPPVQVPGEFFGYASRPSSGKRFAFFKSGDDVLVVAEGDTFFNNYRLVRIGNDSADVVEISSGRHAQVAMVQPASGGVGDQGPPPNQQGSQE